MDPNTAMDTLGAGAKAATKFGEIIEKALGPHWTRKQANADAYADQKKLQTIRENPDMDITYVEGKLNVRRLTTEELASRAEQRMLAESLRQECNLEKVLDITSKQLCLVDTVSDEPVDDDWITRLFNIVKDVSNEDMQYVWGKILAGEIQNPGSFSYRTIETLRNMSQLEAMTFQKIAPFVIEGGMDSFITSKRTIHDKYGVTYEDVMLLDECGLILSNGTVTLTIPIDTDSLVAHNGSYCLLTHGVNSQVNITFGVYSLTTTGKELLKIVSREPNNKYFLDFAEHVFKENKYTDLVIQKVKNVEGTTIRTTGEIVQEFCVKQDASD